MTQAQQERAPLVTVLTAARNAAQHIEETIESVRAQTVTDWEYVIVDDASDDQTPEIVERYARSDPRFRLVRRNESGGPYAAANTGLANVRGRYVARLDADDISLPHRLERQLDFLSADPSLRACASYVKVLRDGVLHDYRVRVIPVLPGSLKWSTCVRGFLPSTALVETDAFRELGGYRELPLSQDHRLWCELARRRWLAGIPEVLVHWRSHEGQLSRQKWDLQGKLGSDVVRDHLSALTGREWSDEDAYRLHFAGRRPIPFRDGLNAIKRFERMWKADSTLRPAERHELIQLTRQLRREHLKESSRTALEEARWGRAVLGAYRRARLARQH